jgi:hypothetical protein
MDLRERAKTLREGIEGSMGQQVIQLQQLNARADTSTLTTAANPTGDAHEQQWPPPPPPHLLQGGQQPPYPPLPQGPRPAAPTMQQVPGIYRLAGPPLGAGARMTCPANLGAAPAATPRPTNPYSFTGPGYRHQQQPQFPTQEQLPFQQQPGSVFMRQGYGSFQAHPDSGMGQYPTLYGAGTWQDGSGGYRQPVRFPATLIPVQPYEVQAACSWASNCWAELPGDRVPGFFSISQTGEILTIRSPREGEE